MPIIITPIATAVATVSVGLGPGYHTVTVAVPKTAPTPYTIPTSDLPPAYMQARILEKISAGIPTPTPTFLPLLPLGPPFTVTKSPNLLFIENLITYKCGANYSPATARTKGRYYAPLILSASKTHNIPPLILANLFWYESNYNPREISHSGALGLGQIMPLWFRYFHTPTYRWSDPHTNINLTCKVLNFYRTQTSKTYPHISPTNTWHRTLVAYNMGFSRVHRGTYRSRYSSKILRDTYPRKH